MINELHPGERLIGQFLLADVKKGVKDSGAIYWTLLLQDSSGTIEAKKWDYSPSDEEILVKGSVINLDAEVLKYRNALQAKIRLVAAVPQDQVDWSRFVGVAPMPLEEMKGKLFACLDSIKDPAVHELTGALLNDFMDNLLVWPAAVRNHHDYVGGLLFHSLTMVDVAVNVCKIYPAVNRDLVLAGVLIHDLGKTIELSGTKATAFTLEGKLLGHISIGHAELRKKAQELGYYAFDALSEEEKATRPDLAHKKEVAVLLEHIVLSHHGKPDFGSPVMPATREALVVSMVDDLDAKMNILDKALKPVEPGGITGRLYNMDDRYFYKPTFAKDDDHPGLTLKELEEDLKD